MSHGSVADEMGVLKGSLIFEDLNDESMEGLLEESMLQRFPKGTDLFYQGDIPEFLYLLLEGALELYITDFNGNETIIEIIEGPHAYMLASVLSMVPYLASGRMVRPGRVLMLRETSIRRWVTTDIQLSHNMLGLLSRQFRTMVRQVTSLKLQSTVERLGHYILTLQQEQGAARDVILPYDKRRIAVRLGMTPVSLSRAFSRLGELQVTVSGRKVTIGNIERLREYCRPEEFLDEREENLRFVPCD